MESESLELLDLFKDFATNTILSGLSWDGVKISLGYSLHNIAKKKGLNFKSVIGKELEDIEKHILNFDMLGVQDKFALLKSKYSNDKRDIIFIGIFELLLLSSSRSSNNLILEKINQLEKETVDINDTTINILFEFIKNFALVFTVNEDSKELYLSKIIELKNVLDIVDKKKENTLLENDMSFMVGIAHCINALSKKEQVANHYKEVGKIFESIQLDTCKDEMIGYNSIISTIVGLYYLRLFALTKDNDHLKLSRNLFMQSYSEENTNVIALSYYAFLDLLCGYTAEALGKFQKAKNQLNKNQLLNRVMFGESICYLVLQQKEEFKVSLNYFSDDTLLNLENLEFRSIIELLKKEL